MKRKILLYIFFIFIIFQKNLLADEININSKNPEFMDWKWIEFSKLPNIAVHFKVNIYRKIKKELTSLSLN